MEKVTQGTAATAEESAAASEELSAQANTTMAVVHQLRALVGATDRAAESAPRPTRRPKHALASNVVPLTRKPAKAAASNEDLFPLQGTGTFGSF